MKQYHIPVMIKEVLEFLEIKKGGLYLDGTLGDGGHTSQILKKGGRVIAFDQDQDAIKRATDRLKDACPDIKVNLDVNNLKLGTLTIVKTNFSNLNQVLTNLKIKGLDGILLDLGASTYQLTSTQRGFSFNSDSPLDMRMDQSLAVTARDILNFVSEKELANMLKELGGEERAKSIARAIKKKIPGTTKELADLVASIKPQTGRLHPATKVFQSLRMAVNQERDSLRTVLPQAIKWLNKDKNLVVLSFHQGEDKIVKNYFKQEAEKESIKILTSKPLTPTDEEKNSNPRARSTKLRAIKKI